MLHNAATTDANLPTHDDMFEYCKAFMSQQTWAKADQELCHHFEERGRDNVAWFKVMTKALYLGKFIYMNPGALSNFSVFAFYEEQAIAIITCNTFSSTFNRVKALATQLMRPKHQQNRLATFLKTITV